MPQKPEKLAKSRSKYLWGVGVLALVLGCIGAIWGLRIHIATAALPYIAHMMGLPISGSVSHIGLTSITLQNLRIGTPVKNTATAAANQTLFIKTLTAQYDWDSPLYVHDVQINGLRAFITQQNGATILAGFPAASAPADNTPPSSLSFADLPDITLQDSMLYVDAGVVSTQAQAIPIAGSWATPPAQPSPYKRLTITGTLDFPTAFIQSLLPQQNLETSALSPFTRLLVPPQIKAHITADFAHNAVMQDIARPPTPRQIRAHFAPVSPPAQNAPPNNAHTPLHVTLPPLDILITPTETRLRPFTLAAHVPPTLWAGLHADVPALDRLAALRCPMNVALATTQESRIAFGLRHIMPFLQGTAYSAAAETSLDIETHSQFAPLHISAHAAPACPEGTENQINFSAQITANSTTTKNAVTITAMMHQAALHIQQDRFQYPDPQLVSLKAPQMHLTLQQPLPIAVVQIPTGMPGADQTISTNTTLWQHSPLQLHLQGQAQQLQHGDITVQDPLLKMAAHLPTLAADAAFTLTGSAHAKSIATPDFRTTTPLKLPSFTATIAAKASQIALQSAHAQLAATDIAGQIPRGPYADIKVKHATFDYHAPPPSSAAKATITGALYARISSAENRLIPLFSGDLSLQGVEIANIRPDSQKPLAFANVTTRLDLKTPQYKGHALPTTAITAQLASLQPLQGNIHVKNTALDSTLQISPHKDGAYYASAAIEKAVFSADGLQPGVFWPPFLSHIPSLAAQLSGDVSGIFSPDFEPITLDYDINSTLAQLTTSAVRFTDANISTNGTFDFTQMKATSQGKVHIGTLIPTDYPLLTSGPLETSYSYTGGITTAALGDLDLKQTYITLFKGRLLSPRIRISPRRATAILSYITLKNMDLDLITRVAQVPDFRMTGRLSGTVPVRISFSGATFENAHLATDGAGTIRYGSQISDINVKAAPSDVAAAGGLDIALKALENLQYKAIKLDFSGDPTKNITAQTHISGFNPALLDGYPFEFNLNIEGPVVVALLQAFGRAIPIAHFLPKTSHIPED